MDLHYLRTHKPMKPEVFNRILKYIGQDAQKVEIVLNKFDVSSLVSQLEVIVKGANIDELSGVKIDIDKPSKRVITSLYQQSYNVWQQQYQAILNSDTDFLKNQPANIYLLKATWSIGAGHNASYVELTPDSVGVVYLSHDPPNYAQKIDKYLKNKLHFTSPKITFNMERKMEECLAFWSKPIHACDKNR